MNIIQKIKMISDTLECQSIYPSLVKHMQLLERQSIAVGVLGTANTGKSSIINAMAGTSLPTSPISTMQDYYVSYETSNPSTVASSSSWMKEHNISFIEKAEKIFSNKSKDGEYASYFAHFDICLYIIDAQMAYTQNDALIIEHLDKFGIPTLVCVSKYEKIPADEHKVVSSYLINKLPQSDVITIVKNEKFISMVDNAPTIISAIENWSKSDYIQTVRNNLTSIFVIDAVAQLYEECNAKIAKCQEEEQQAEVMTAEKLSKISSLETEWMRIELQLTKQRQMTENILQEKLAKRKKDMLRRLKHDIEVTSDVGHYWNKELSYRIDDMMRAELQTYTQIINTDIVNTLKWLQAEILKTFKKQAGFVLSITCTIDNKETTLDAIEISDNKNLKIITRVGSAVTIFVAGSLLATSGVAGVIMAFSMLSGIGAEWIMNLKTKESRAKVLEVLPSILDKCELVYINQISASLKASYNEILGNIKTSQADWKAKAIATIEEEHQIAIHNCGREKYQQCMKEINELSACLISES